MTNYTLGDLISRLNIASDKRLVSVRLSFTVLTLSVLNVFLKNGIINGLAVQDKYVTVYLKYYRHKPVFKEIVLVSRPSKRVY